MAGKTKQYVQMEKDAPTVDKSLRPRGISYGTPPEGLRNWNCAIDGHEDPDRSGGCIHCYIDLDDLDYDTPCGCETAGECMHPQGFIPPATKSNGG